MASDNLKLNTVDEVIAEPLGGAHRDPAAVVESLEKWITQNLRELKRFKIDNLIHKRFNRLRKVGRCVEE